MGNLEFIPIDSVHKVGDTVDGVQNHCKHKGTRTYTHIPIHTLQSMVLDFGRKPEYPEEIPKAQGERVHCTHTGWRFESNPQPWTPNQSNILTTKPDNSHFSYLWIFGLLVFTIKRPHLHASHSSHFYQDVAITPSGIKRESKSA